jgi:glutamyl-tRNA reductase
MPRLERKFSLDALAKTRLLEQAKEEGIESNRNFYLQSTEIYGFAEHLSINQIDL